MQRLLIDDDDDVASSTASLSLRRECVMLLQCGHPHIVTAVGSLMRPESSSCVGLRGIVMERGRDSWRHHLQRVGVVSLPHVVAVMTHVARALAYLHSR